MTTVLAQVHKATAAVAQDDDIDLNLDPALAACVQLGLAGPHLAPPPEPAARFKAAWRSGAAHADMSADKFLARLCALVPPPGYHMTRYFGVFANRPHLRPRIIAPSPVPTPGQQFALGLADSANDKPDDDTESSPRPRRLVWAKLLARVFAVDVTVCRKCPPRGPRATPAPSSRTGLVVPRLTARSDVALTPACPSLGRGGRGARFRALPSCNTFQNLTIEAVGGRAPCSPFGPHPSTIAHQVLGPPPKFLPETS